MRTRRIYTETTHTTIGCCGSAPKETAVKQDACCGSPQKQEEPLKASACC